MRKSLNDLVRSCVMLTPVAAQRLRDQRLDCRQFCQHPRTIGAGRKRRYSAIHPDWLFLPVTRQTLSDLDLTESCRLSRRRGKHSSLQYRSHTKQFLRQLTSSPIGAYVQ